MARKTKIPAKLTKYLDKLEAKYEIIEHRTVYTALDAAATMKKKVDEIAKSLLVKADKDYYVVVLPADNNLDLDKVGKLLSKEAGKEIKSVKIPGEKIMENVFKIKAGAMSAFGGAHKLPVIIDNKLTKIKKAVFSSGSFNHSIEMLTKDFIKFEEPLKGSLGKKKKIKPAPKKKTKKRAVSKKKTAPTKKKAKPAAKKRVATRKKTTGKK